MNQFADSCYLLVSVSELLPGTLGSSLPGLCMPVCRSRVRCSITQVQVFASTHFVDMSSATQVCLGLMSLAAEGVLQSLWSPKVWENGSNAFGLYALFIFMSCKACPVVLLVQALGSG